MKSKINPDLGLRHEECKEQLAANQVKVKRELFGYPIGYGAHDKFTGRPLEATNEA